MSKLAKANVSTIWKSGRFLDFLFENPPYFWFMERILCTCNLCEIQRSSPIRKNAMHFNLQSFFPIIIDQLPPVPCRCHCFTYRQMKVGTSPFFSQSASFVYLCHTFWSGQASAGLINLNITSISSHQFSSSTFCDLLIHSSII